MKSISAIVTTILVLTLSFNCTQAATITPVPYGTYGTLIIYGTDVNLALDYLGAFEDNDYAQSLVDNPERGVLTNYYDYYGYPVSKVIADHKNQGFDAIYDVVPNETVCELFYPNETSQKFICREKVSGENNGTITINGVDVEYLHPSDWIIMYTCNPEGWWSVTITFWEPLNS